MPERLSPQDFESLRKIDTPTICNLLEIVAPERRGFGFTFQHLHCIFPALPPIVGYAKTATIRARMPAVRTREEGVEFRARYLDYIERGSAPKISIVQDLDERPGYGALWGEVFTTVHKSLGVRGVVTNGSVRDLDMIAEDFQLLAGLIAPSHAHVHICDFGCEANVHGMTVNDGDLVHADRHGAVVIPHAVAREIPKALDLMLRREKVIIDAAKQPDVTAEKLKRAWQEAGAIYE
ncbi:MAG: RraA family protein [Parvibaculaceae bacterium]